VVNGSEKNKSFLKNKSLISNGEVEEHLRISAEMRKWKISFCLHMFIPLYGFCITLLVFFPNLLS